MFGKHPLLVKGEAGQYVDDIGDDVGEVARLHELGYKIGEGFQDFKIPQGVDAAFEDQKVQAVGAQEYNKESGNFRRFFVGTLKIPYAVHDVAVAAAGDKT